jgi:hypothetical protein
LAGAVRPVRAALERAFSRGWPPSRVARAIVRSVRSDLAIVPVGPEAWIGYWTSRLSPRLVGLAAKQALSTERIELAMRRTPKRLRDRITA